MTMRIKKCAVCQGFAKKTILGFCEKCAEEEIEKLRKEAEEAILRKDEKTLLNRNERLRILMGIDTEPTTRYHTELFGMIEE